MTVVKDSGARADLPPFTEEHRELRETVNRFVTAEIAPHVDEWEAAREFPRELFGRCAELGFLGLKFPEAYGGQGGTHLHDAVWVEELARAGGSGGVAAGLNAHSSIAMPPIFNFGSEEQKQRWLVPGIAGEKVGALGITEPGAGSDVASITTTAKRDGDRFIVNGAKTFITNGVRADFLVCACKTTADGGHGGISFLVLEREMPGYEVDLEAGEDGLALLRHWRAGLHRPRGAGGEPARRGERWLQADHGQLRLGAAADGDRRRRRDAAPDRDHRRLRLRARSFGRPIGKFQAIRHQVAEMATEAEAARAQTYAALRLFDEGGDCIREVAIAKLLTQRTVLEIADRSLQIHGGYGYMREYGIERAVRDARLGPIGGGTDEIMKEIIGKTMGL